MPWEADSLYKVFLKFPSVVTETKRKKAEERIGV
jgi:hypothetical protein